MSQLSEAEEDFHLKAEKMEVKKTVHIAIDDLAEKFDDQENKTKPIKSPKFKVGETSLAVWVYPQYKNEKTGEYVAVYLQNEEKESVTATTTFSHASGVKKTFKNQEIATDWGYWGFTRSLAPHKGFTRFLSHKAYKKWAKDHGDVFKLEVEITLHVKKPAQWTRNR